MRIADILTFSLIDYPGYPSAVIFTAGCNLRCPWCHNWEIAYGNKGISDIRVENILEGRLKERVKAICVSGGEPTINEDLPEFLDYIKKIGYMLKLDTNGTNPEMVKTVIEKVDYIAIDVKSSPERYPLLTGVERNYWPEVSESIKMARKSKTSYELRMTYVPELSDVRDIRFFAEFTKGENAFLTIARSTSKFKVSGDLPEKNLGIKIR
ncbi:MAG: anaerobic ribonucleoside-triphosphate reductase activating protein [Athalassotoga sp.]